MNINTSCKMHKNWGIKHFLVLILKNFIQIPQQFGNADIF